MELLSGEALKHRFVHGWFARGGRRVLLTRSPHQGLLAFERQSADLRGGLTRPQIPYNDHAMPLGFFFALLVLARPPGLGGQREDSERPPRLLCGFAFRVLPQKPMSSTRFFMWNQCCPNWPA